MKRDDSAPKCIPVSPEGRHDHGSCLRPWDCPCACASCVSAKGRSDINTLDAGPALDALVAEKVMGAKVVKRREGTFDLVIPGGPNSVDWVTREGALSGAPCYSKDIAAAWEVVSKFKSFRIDNHGDYDDKGEGFMVEINDDVKNLHGKAWGPTAPIAICRAALQAVGI